MLPRLIRPVLLAFALAGSAAAADPTPAVPFDLPEPAASASPAEFVESIYVIKLKAEAFSAYQGRTTTAYLTFVYLTPDFVNQIKLAYEIDEPVIDGDIFTMAQEWEITEVKAKTVKQTADTATVEAHFKNYGKPEVVTFSLKKSPTRGWMVDDVSSERGGHVRGWIADALAGRR